MATMNDNKANVRKRRLVFSFVVVVDDCLDFSELLVDDADEGGGEGLVPLPEAVGVTVVGRIDFFGMVNMVRPSLHSSPVHTKLHLLLAHLL